MVCEYKSGFLLTRVLPSKTTQDKVSEKLSDFVVSPHKCFKSESKNVESK